MPRPQLKRGFGVARVPGGEGRGSGGARNAPISHTAIRAGLARTETLAVGATIARGQHGAREHQRDAHEELSPAFAAREIEAASVSLDHHRARDGQALPRTAPHVFGREEGVEDGILNRVRNPIAVVGDLDQHVGAYDRGADTDSAAPTATAILYRVRGVDQQIQEYLIELTHVTRHERKVAQIELDVRATGVLLLADRER